MTSRPTLELPNTLVPLALAIISVIALTAQSQGDGVLGRIMLLAGLGGLVVSTRYAG